MEWCGHVVKTFQVRLTSKRKNINGGMGSVRCFRGFMCNSDRLFFGSGSLRTWTSCICPPSTSSTALRGKRPPHCSAFHAGRIGLDAHEHHDCAHREIVQSYQRERLEGNHPAAVSGTNQPPYLIPPPVLCMLLCTDRLVVSFWIY
jgi:hypothetical protein